MKKLTLTEWQERYTLARERAERTSRMILDRARTCAFRAGLDPHLLGIHPHNAMVSFNSGNPWPGVDYHLVRKCLWLQKRAWEPTRLAEAYGSRLWSQVEF